MVKLLSFNPTGTKGFYVHRDDSTSGNSSTGLPGRGFKKMSKGEWMIRAVVKKKE